MKLHRAWDSTFANVRKSSQSLLHVRTYSLLHKGAFTDSMGVQRTMRMMIVLARPLRRTR